MKRWLLARNKSMIVKKSIAKMKSTMMKITKTHKMKAVMMKRFNLNQQRLSQVPMKRVMNMAKTWLMKITWTLTS